MIAASDRRSSRFAAIALLVACVLASGPASAEPTAQEKETARALMDRGDESFEAKRFEAALEAYAGAHAIMRVPTTAVEVAKAHEALGHLVEARDACLEAGRYPQSAGEPAAFAVARADAAKRARELGERIPSITLQLTGLPDGHDPRVTIDDVALPPIMARLPIKVNPGHHVVRVSSDVNEEASTEVDVKERETASVSLELRRRAVAETPAPPPTGPARERSVLPLVGLGVAGLGVAGLAAGTVFGLSASSKQDDAGCANNVCRTPDSAEKLREANTAADLSTIFFVAGGILAAAGVTLWLVAPNETTKSANAARSRYASLLYGRLEL